jgi:phosphatidylserine/phosphatidylglycerophosphate/cardiolipin synthase-like enzyme
VLPAVSRPTLLALAEALESGRLDGPFNEMALRRHVPAHECGHVVACFGALGGCGFTPAQMAVFMRSLADERARAQAVGDRVQLVWTGPEVASSASRDTSVVMREMFQSAERSVLVSGFAIYRGRAVLAALGRRMAERPQLHVRLFLNVHRVHGSTASEAEILKKFADDFMRRQWPGGRIPDIYYDPRSLAVADATRAALHAKCVVVDDLLAFITSANLTEAAQERNIEAGVLIEDATFAWSVTSQFTALVESGILRRLPV